MNLSSNISALENEDYPFIANALALACDVSAKDVYVSQHLSLPEFLFTACAVVVALTATGTLWAIFKKMEACFIRRWNSVGQQEKVAPIVVEVRTIDMPHHLPKTKPANINKGIAKPKNRTHTIQNRKNPIDNRKKFSCLYSKIISLFDLIKS